MLKYYLDLDLKDVAKQVSTNPVLLWYYLDIDC